MKPPRNAVVLLPDRNKPLRNDFGGAFQPEAVRFIKHHNLPCKATCISIGKPFGVRGIDVTKALVGHTEPLDTVAFFCHGYSRSIQLGFTRADVDNLARVLAPVSTSDLRVVLYSCTVGSWIKGTPGGDGGFADLLRDALCRHGVIDCQVDAHTTGGHCTENPFVRRFRGKGSPVGGVGGEWIVEKGKELWARWVTLMKMKSGTLRFDFPFMSQAEIHQHILDSFEVQKEAA